MPRKRPPLTQQSLDEQYGRDLRGFLEQYPDLKYKSLRNKLLEKYPTLTGRIVNGTVQRWLQRESHGGDMRTLRKRPASECVQISMSGLAQHFDWAVHVVSMDSGITWWGLQTRLREERSVMAPDDNVRRWLGSLHAAASEVQGHKKTSGAAEKKPLKKKTESVGYDGSARGRRLARTTDGGEACAARASGEVAKSISVSTAIGQEPLPVGTLSHRVAVKTTLQLDEEHGRAMLAGLKIWEGRALTCPGVSKLKEGDSVRFNSGMRRTRLVLRCRLAELRHFDSLEEMIAGVGPAQLLPTGSYDVHGAAEKYRTFSKYFRQPGRFVAFRVGDVQQETPVYVGARKARRSRERRGRAESNGGGDIAKRNREKPQEERGGQAGRPARPRVDISRTSE